MVAEYNDCLDRPMARVRSVLSDRPMEHKYEWLEEIRSSQEDLMQALRHHVVASEEPNGSLAAIANALHGSVATLDRRVRQLRKEHVDLLTSASELLRFIDQSSDHLTSDMIPAIQERCNRFLCKVEAHQQCECNLFVDAMTMDAPGAGD